MRQQRLKRCNSSTSSAKPNTIQIQAILTPCLGQLERIGAHPALLATLVPTQAGPTPSAPKSDWLLARGPADVELEVWRAAGDGVNVCQLVGQDG